ncbi:hypothetical protein AOQ84DRAFT_121670 [Glonium stellatum]|uniref:Uncharacterized protein n=1 Tax=Glonium stellatum TaxID=574774 RepID=A0A8E2ESZ9_9PEZI|nr:hypothetical protein AOQ84DRAFT_121670 [Glonium stellatum]
MANMGIPYPCVISHHLLRFPGLFLIFFLGSCCEARIRGGVTVHRASRSAVGKAITADVVSHLHIQGAIRAKKHEGGRQTDGRKILCMS